MSDQPAPERNERDIGAPPAGTDSDPGGNSVQSTVGTGSVIGLGCLALVVVLVVLAIAYRLLGGSW